MGQNSGDSGGGREGFQDGDEVTGHLKRGRWTGWAGARCQGVGQWEMGLEIWLYHQEPRLSCQGM